MIVTILAILLILGIAYLQMMQGLFSSILMAVCAVFSAAIAVSFYEAAAAATGLYEMQPAIADAVCWGLLFVAGLFGLRYLADRFIRDDIYFDVLIDRLGGAVFGLLSGTMMIGVLLVVLQLAPFGRIIFGDFRPYQDTLLRDMRVAPFFPDEFVVGFGKRISAGSMSGAVPLAQEHDDLLLEAFCARNTAGRDGRIDTNPNAITLLELYDADEWAENREDIPPNPMLDEYEPTKVIVLRVAVNVSATGQDDWWRLPATQFRLHSRQGEEAFRSDYPLGYLYYDRDTNAYVVETGITNADGHIEPAKQIVQRPSTAGVYGQDKYGEGKVPADKINLFVDWVYRIPQDAVPEAMFFRRTDGVKAPDVLAPLNLHALRERMLTTQPPEEPRRKRRSRRKK